MGKKSKKFDNTMTQWYNVLPTHLKHKVENPAYANHKIDLACRIVCVGNSGSGKSQLCCEMIYRMPNTFSHIVLCCQNANEPLYQFLRTKIPEEQFTICEKIQNIPDLDTLPHGDGDHTLVIMDDMVHEKNQSKIEEYYVRARKIPASIIYLSQSFFGVPKLIRQNCTHLWLRKVSGARDINLILSDVNIGLEKEELMDMYRECIKDNSFLNIRVVENDEKERFYKGFLERMDTHHMLSNRKQDRDADGSGTEEEG